MKKLLFSAAALTAASSAFANESDWAQLDQDIQALSASLQGVENSGPTIGGRIRAAYENSGDVSVPFDTDGDGTPDVMNDLGGFTVYNARLYMSGTTANDIGYRLEVDFAGGPLAGTGLGLGGANLLDAYLDIPVAGEITVRVGQFRAFVLRESQIDSGDLMFFDRSVPAALFAGRSQGIAVNGDMDAFGWAVTIQNGGDAQGDDLFYALRGEIDFLGESGVGNVEGAYGASEDLQGTAGVAYFNDDAVDDADGFAVEAVIASSQFSGNLTIVSTGDGISGSNVDLNERNPVGLAAVADATIFSLGGSFMLTQESSEYGAWELGARLQDLDNDADTTIIDVGANYYVAGHDMKYIINFTQVDSDAGFDGSIFRLGVQSRF